MTKKILHLMLVSMFLSSPLFVLAEDTEHKKQQECSTSVHPYVKSVLLGAAGGLLAAVGWEAGRALYEKEHEVIGPLDLYRVYEQLRVNSEMSNAQLINLQAQIPMLESLRIEVRLLATQIQSLLAAGNTLENFINTIKTNTTSSIHYMVDAYTNSYNNQSAQEKILELASEISNF